MSHLLKNKYDWWNKVCMYFKNKILKLNHLNYMFLLSQMQKKEFDLFLPHDPFGLETMKPMVEEKKDEIQPFG